MKKLLLALLVIIAISTNAQTFEGGYLMPGFEKEIPIHSIDLSGRYIGCKDYAAFTPIDAPMLSKDEALNLALMLIKAPKELRLRRDIGNIIRSSGGYVIIFFSNTKQTWALNFHSGEDVRDTGEKSIRCFYMN